MQVQLDDEVWEVNEGVSLGEVLANLSDRAQAKGCLVTELIVGNRRMTDRELIPPTLAQMAGSFGSIGAVSKGLKTLIRYSEETGKQFAQQLCLNGQKLVQEFRHGHKRFHQLDQWFGQMADYLEWVQIQEITGLKNSEVAQELTFWMNELMQARTIEDEVRIADLLEYEIGPRLTGSHPTSM